MMLPQVTELTPRLEAILADYIADLTTEFRNYDAADLIALIRLERMATLRSLLDGECEMLFKSETMRFGEHAEVVLDWDAPPSIRLAMVFRNQGIELYYRLTLEAANASVEIDLIRFEQPEPTALSRSARLQRALADSRTGRRSDQSSSFRQET
jgi:hypothetical protein